MKFDQRRRQANGRGAFHRSEPQHPARLGIVHRFARLVSETDQPVRIVEQDGARRREVELLAVADEQLDAELLLELLHPRGDVRLHAVELFGRARDAARLHDGAEDLEVGQIHRSLS